MRRQELLDRAEEWMHRLYRCAGQGRLALENLQQLQQAEDAKDDISEILALRAEHSKHKAILSGWDWSGPVLPVGEITHQDRSRSHEFGTA